MSIIKNKPVRKTVIKGNQSFNFESFDIVINSDENYITNGETLLIVRDVEQSKVKLDSITTERVKIKTLTNCVIVPDIGRIDEEWDEISIGKGACVELQNVNGVWYILSSDGIKMD
jgi:hypothetical protein